MGLKKGRSVMDLNKFLEWAKQGHRSIDIKLVCRHGEITKKKVWVFDYHLLQGQHVESVDEIDIESVTAAREKAEYERLKAKYEGATT